MGPTGGAASRLERWLASDLWPGLFLLALGGATLATFWLAFAVPALFPGVLADPAGFWARLRLACLGRDPETGSLSWAYPLSTLAGAVSLGGVLALFWPEEVRRCLARARRAASGWRGLLAALAVLALLAAPVVLARLRGPAAGEPALAWLPPFPVPEVVLRDQDGRAASLPAVLRGRASLLAFLYLDCGDACPTAVRRAEEAWRAVAGAHPLAGVVLVTVDPERDRPERLRSWLRGRAHGPSWRGLAGDAATTGRLLRLLRVPAGVPDPRTGALSHAAVGFLVDGRGRALARVDLARIGAGRLALAWNTVARDLSP